MTMIGYGRRVDRLEAAIGPTVTLEAQHVAECLAADLGCTADELIADAARIAALYERPGDTPEMVATRWATTEGHDVAEVLADMQRVRERYG